MSIRETSDTTAPTFGVMFTNPSCSSGVYSWVPGSVQDRILAICARHLVPEGIGYVSYNTYPGWH